MAQSTNIASIVCERHWPKQLDVHPYSIFLIFLMVSEIEKDKEYIERALDYYSLEKSLMSFYPLCCYLGDDKMNELYQKAAKISTSPAPL